MPTIHRSPQPDVAIPDVAITDYLLDPVARVPDRVALVDGPSGRSYTYAAFAEAVGRCAGGLASRGIGPGHTVGLMAPNLPEYAVVFHGTARAGGVVTTINPTYGAEEVAFQLRDAGAELLVTVPPFLDIALAASEALRSARSW